MCGFGSGKGTEFCFLVYLGIVLFMLEYPGLHWFTVVSGSFG